jgi:outer membrane protein assembly factor BamB
MLKFSIRQYVISVLSLITITGDRKKKSVISLFLFFLFFLASSVTADDWRGWRGLEKQACNDSIEGPDEWASTSNILWQVEIEGEGHSSPVVTENNVFVTTANLDDNKINLNMIIVNVLLISFIILVLLNLFSQFKNFLKNRNLSGKKFISELLIFSLYGFLIFIFCIMHWMYFDENRSQSARILINYLFTGSVFFLCLLFLITRFPKKSIIRIISGLVIIILDILLVKFMPLQDYYTTPDFFQLWIFQLIIPGVILPLLLSIFIIFKTIAIRNKSQTIQDHNLKTSPEKSLSSLFLIFSAISAFALGIAGYMAIPLISVAKISYRDKISRIQESLKFSTLFSPDLAFPFFLGVLSIGFLLWFILENKKNEFNRKGQFYFYAALLCCSSIFFIMNNFTIRNPEYKREIHCVDRFSGLIKWKKVCLVGLAEGTSTYNSQATPTPAIHNNSVYAYFGNAGLVSTDFNGNINWENKNLPFECIHGVGASPIFCRDGIVILNATSKNPYLTLLDFKTGKQKWKTELKSSKGSLGEYRTPVLFELNGQELIIEWSFFRNELVFYKAKTGEVMYMYNPEWNYEGESITTPVINGGIIYLSNSLNVVAVDIYKLIDGKSPIIWEADLKKRGPETSSPVLTKGMLYTVSDNGFVTCLNSTTGEILWQKKLPGTYFSSPIISGKKVYFSNTGGLTTVLECSPLYNKIAENQLPEGIYSTLVPIDGQLFIRSKNTLWCVK